MRDVYFLDWTFNVGDKLEQRQEIGHIETSKAQSDLYAPIAGTLVSLNEEILKDPSAINIDNYGAGWLFEWPAPTKRHLTPTATTAFSTRTGKTRSEF